MIISADAKSLEWVVAAYLSQDKVAYEEIWNGVDQHSDNQQRFGLPSRLIAKTFVFRLIYGGSAWSYANDPNFAAVSTNVEFWQGVIDAFYAKYEGIQRWHDDLLERAGREGCIISPSGRTYRFKPYQKRGEWHLPRTTILNYPVQGLGADIMMLARISLWNRMRQARCVSKLVNTVHDDIWIDAPKEELLGLDSSGNPCYNIISEVEKVFEDLPQNFERAFKVPFNLPMKCEVSSLNGEEIK